MPRSNWARFTMACTTRLLLLRRRTHGVRGASGMSATFVENIRALRTGARRPYRRRAVCVRRGGEQTLPTRVACSASTARRRHALGSHCSTTDLADDIAGDQRYTRSCLSVCPGVLAMHGVLEECINCGATAPSCSASCPPPFAANPAVTPPTARPSPILAVTRCRTRRMVSSPCPG